MTQALATKAQTAHDEQAIRTQRDLFAQGFVMKDPGLRASIWAENGTLVPPVGGLLCGRQEIERHFATQIAAVTPESQMTFSDYRFRFITPDVAFVDVDITLHNILGPDGQPHRALLIGSAFTAVRASGVWLVLDERAYFKPLSQHGNS